MATLSFAEQDFSFDLSLLRAFYYHFKAIAYYKRKHEEEGSSRERERERQKRNII
jgi:hypothetical protein